MSITVDQRVVEMRFDNKQFEANVSTTMSTLEKLKSKLNFTDSAKGLSAIGDRIKQCDFSGMQSGIEIVQAKFSALQIMGMTALTNITYSAVDAGRKMVNALTIEPVKSGFDEYELKMGSLQTIMASTGESLEVVNEYLNELNVYSDRTIYSFSDMTENIGKFTNSGVKLKDAVTAIKGVSNVAALAGANANEASRAMYNFAQALSSGSVKLIDWKSIENANMATVGFKEQLIQTAVELGTVVKVGEQYRTVTTDANGSVSDLFTSTTGFNDALSNQWMTTDVLVKTLSKYTDETTELGQQAYAAAQDIKTFSQLVDTLKESAGSGWATTWELIFGDLNEAKKLWTEVNDVIGTFISVSSDARNKIVKEWKDFGGRTAIFDGLIDAFTALTNVGTAFKKAFANIFPNTSGEGWALMSKRIALIAKGFAELTERNMPKLQKSFESFFVIVKAITTVVGGVFRIAFKASIIVITLLSQVIIDISERIADVILNFNEWIKQNTVLTKGLKVVASIIATVVKAIVTLVSNIITGIGKAILIVTTLVREFMQLEVVQKIITGFTTTVGTVFNLIKSFVLSGIYIIHEFINAIRNLDQISLDNIKTIFADFGEKIKEHFSGVGEVVEGISDSVGAFQDTVETSFATTGKTVEKLQRKFQTFARIVSSCLYSIGPAEVFAVGFGVALIYFLRKFTLAVNKITKPVASFSGVLDKFGGVLESVKWAVKASALTSAALAITMMAASLVVLAKVCTPEELATPLATILLLGTVMTVFAKFAGSFGNVDKFVISVLSLAGSIVLLVAAMKIVETIDYARIADTFAVVVGLFTTITGLSGLLAKFAPVLSANAKFMLALSGAVLLLSISVDRIASIDENKVSQAMANMMLIASGLAAVSLAVSGLKMGSAAGILLIAGGVYALLEVVKLIGSFTVADAENTIGVLLGVAIAVLPLFLATQAAGKYAAGAGLALIGMAAAFIMMQRTFTTLSEIDSDKLTGVSGNIFALMIGMAALVAATKFARKTALQAGTMLLEMAGAMVILTVAITLLSHLELGGVVKATAVILGIMYMMKLCIEATGYAKECKATLLILAVVIALMVASIDILAMIPTEDLVLAAGALIGSMVVFSQMIKVLNMITDAGKYAGKAFAGLGTMFVVLVLIGGFLKALQEFEVSADIETVGSICLLLISMTAAMAILSAIGPLAVTGIAGAQTLLSAMLPIAAVVAVLGTIVALMGKYLPEGTEAALERGFGILKTFTYGIGEVVGSLIGGLGAGIFSGLESIGNSLTNFMSAVSGFIEGVRGIDQMAVDGAENLCTILGKFAFNTFLSSLFGASDSFDKIAASNVEGAIGAVNVIGQLGDNVSKLKKLTKWFEENDVAAFKRNMTVFGEAMTGFASSANSFPEDFVAKAKAMSETLTTLQNGIVNNKLFDEQTDLKAYGKELSDFGDELNLFYTKISKVNGGQLANVMAGLDSLTTAVKNMGTLDSNTISTFRAVFTNMGEQAIQAFVDTLKNATPKVREGVNHLCGSISGAISSNISIIQASGQTIIANIILGMESMSEKAKDASHKIVMAAYSETVKPSLYNSFYQSGQVLVIGFVNGMKSKKKSAEKAAAKIAQATLDSMDETLDIHSPSVEAFIRGVMSVMGFEEGIDYQMPTIATTIDKGLQENVLNPLSNIESKIKEQGSGTLSGWTDAIYESIIAPASKYVPELDTMFGEVTATMENITSDTESSIFSGLTDALSSAGVSSNDLSKALKGTSAGTSSLSKALNTTTKRKEIDINKTYEATTALEKYMERLYKESEQYKTDTETLKEYRSELEELQKEQDEMQKKLKDNTEGRIKLSNEEKEQLTEDLKEMEETIYSKQEDIASHLETMCDNAKNIFDNLRDSIKSSLEDALDISNLEVDPGFDLLSEFKLDEDVTPESILENMKSQVEGVKDWMEDLEKLGDRDGTHAGLVEYLRNMGVSGASQVKAFVKMTNSEFKKAVGYFEESGTLMGQTLLNNMWAATVNADRWTYNIAELLTTGLNQKIIEKLAEMGTSSQEYIDAFLTMTPEEIEQFNALYLSSLEFPESAADKMMDSFVNAGNGAATAFIEAANAVIGTDTETSAAMVEGAVTLGEAMTTGVSTGVGNEEKGAVNTASSVGEKTLDGFEDYLNYKNGRNIGKDVTEGLIKGIESGESGVINAAVKVALAAYEAAKRGLKINSPSVMFETLGRFSDLGMIKGFLALAGDVEDAAVTVGTGAFEGMKKSLRNIATAVDGNFDVQPTIRPIVDLTNVEEGAARVNSLFSVNQSMKLAEIGQQGVNAAIRTRYDAAEQASKLPKGDTNIKFEQNIHSPTALSRIDIYRQTKNQFTAAKEVLSNR